MQAAAATFDPPPEPDSDGGDGDGGFRYTKQLLCGHQAALEFETTMGDVSVNGVDLITCDDDGRIVEFKVMLRPLKALEAVRDRMAAMLETISAD